MGLIEAAAPFRTPLLDTPYTKANPVIRRLDGLPGKIVRGDDYKLHEEDDQDFSGTSTEELEGDVRSTDKALAMYKRSGIAIPDYKRVALVRYNADPVLYTVVDEIIGKNIASASFSTEEFKVIAPAVDKTYATLIKIADYVFFHGGSVIYDLKLDQFVWGNISGGRNKVFFVDLEPESTTEVEKYQGKWTQNGRYFCENYMGDFVHYIKSLEDKMHARMSLARRELTAFAKQFDKPPYQYAAENLVARLYRKK